MKDTELLQRVLDIGDPWQIIRVRDDLGERQIHVWVGEKGPRSGWFFNPKQAATEVLERSWRHVNLGNWRCFVHVACGQSLTGLPWCGESDQPFTRALARQVATLLGEGVKLHGICALLDLRVEDLWKFKHSLDSGKTGLASVPPVAPGQGGETSSGVPAPDHPVWERLLDGSIDIDIRALSLKLLTTKLREQMRVISDAEVRRLKACEMHRYFVRYEHNLAHELAQLRQS